MSRNALYLLGILIVAGPAGADRLQAPPLEPAHGVQGIGSRRTGSNTKFMYDSGSPIANQVTSSFNTKSNQAFRDHNIDNPGELLETTSLYNNPWYWNNVGSLQTELMTSGSGVPLYSPSNGGYYNPYFYDQWHSKTGLRHSGALTGTLGQTGGRFANARVSQEEAENVSGNRAWTPPTPPDEGVATQDNRIGMLNSDRTAVTAHRISTGLNASIDNWSDGRLDRVLGAGVANNNPLRFTGSALRGVGTASAGRSSIDDGLSMYDVARIRDDTLNGRPSGTLGVPWETRFMPARMETAPQTNRFPGQPSSTASVKSPQMEDVYSAMADRASSLYPSSVPLNERLEALERDYRVLRGDLVTNQTGRPKLERAVDVFGPGAAIPGATPAPAASSEGSEDTAKSTAGTVDVLPEPIPWEDFDLILRHGQQVDRFAVNDGSRFDDLLAAGEDKLREGDYFIAERRFNRSLRFTPGHPLALAGLGHAQLGAGLYLSSALTLQGLLGFQPEMIDVTYGPDTLPSREDLDRAVSILSDYLQGDRDLDRYGFLLAYIGHQLGRPALVSQGLEAMQRGEADAALIELLGSVWLEDPAAPAP